MAWRPRDGSYKAVDPHAEIQAIDASDAATSRTTREFIRMLKRWQRHCGVADYLKSFQIELLVIEFLETVSYGMNARCLYDWLVRDFFKYLISQQNLFVIVPGTSELVWLGKALKENYEFANAFTVPERVEKRFEK